MTRNEFIAETAVKFGLDSQAPAFSVVIRWAKGWADDLESAGCAPWQTPPAPALTDAARRGGEAAVEWIEADPTRYVCLDAFNKLIDAVRAYKESL